MTMMGTTLETRVDQPGFNYEFLVYVIISGLLAVFFLLYFNRVFASIVSYAIRTYTWHTYQVYIDVKAIQISLLAGRIFFTGLRYHGPNETILVQHGDVTWRYWLRRAREAALFASEASKDSLSPGGQTNASLPCRIQVRLVGTEWFVYNRSPAYDSVLAGLTGDRASESRSSHTSNEKTETLLRTQTVQYNGSRTNATPSPGDAAAGAETMAFQPLHVEHSSTSSKSADDAIDDSVSSQTLPFVLQLFPIHIEFQKPAIVVGNDNTKAILIVKANAASTTIDALPTETCDLYRQLFKIDFDHPVVEMGENDEFKEDQASRATRERDLTPKKESPARRPFLRPERRKLLNALRDLVPYWRRSVESFSVDSRTTVGIGMPQGPNPGQWQGLSRYLDDRYQDDKARWSSVEYASVTSILDSPSATLALHWDVATMVTDDARRHSSTSFPDNVNGSQAPAWEMSLAIRGGTVNYGPWADRQRAELQRFFYPALSKDATAAVPLAAGSWRLPTQFKIFIELEESVTLRVPTREESKNWRWRGKEPPVVRQVGNKRQRRKSKKNSKRDAQLSRAAGWLEFKLPSNSTISYTMDMLARVTGFQNHLHIDLPSTELWSSVNHELLWKSGAQRIFCDLSNPLEWNTLRTWCFNITCEDMKLYLLRDHIFLLTDLVDDWASGPPSEYLLFSPFVYRLNLNLQRLSIFLNINDENIIDKATVLDDNRYLIISTPALRAETSIQLDKFRPNKNVVPFDIGTEAFDLTLHAPKSDTQAAFLSSNELGRGGSLSISGSYHYNTSTSPANTDTLILDVHGQSPSAYLYGSIIRYMILLKDNYFGDRVHFRTLEEHQEQIKMETQRAKPEIVSQPPNQMSNDLDIILAIKVDNPRILLPVNLYSASRCVEGELADLSVNLRFTNYYMDLELLLSPVSLSMGGSHPSSDTSSSSSSNTQVFLDGIRVFGHRTFGLPPSEPTYMCNWDVAIGVVEGECTANFLSSLAKCGAAFGFMFDDVENALVPYSSLIFHDVTFVRVDVASVHLWMHVDDTALLLSTGPIELRSNDWANSHYSKRANVKIPSIEVSCVNADSAARHVFRGRRPVEATSFLRTDIRLAIVGRKFHFDEEFRLQQALLRREDQRTGRTSFLLHEDVDGDFIQDSFEPPAQCAPVPAFPVTKIDNEDQSSRTVQSPNRLRYQNSFWSLSSSSLSHFDQSPQSQIRSHEMTRRSGNASASSRTTGPGRQQPRRKAGMTQLDLGSKAVKKPIQACASYANMEHSTVAFSSQYVAPHFPLEEVRPDGRLPTFEDNIEADNEEQFFTNGTSLNDLNPNQLSDDHAQTSVMIEFPSGIVASLDPEAVRCANSLLAAMQPNEPEDILDFLQVDSVGQIFSDKKQSHIKGSMQEILVKLPKANIRFLNCSARESHHVSQEEQDQYDIRMSNALLLTRTVKGQESGILSPRTSLCFRLKSAEMSASERLSSVETPQAAVMINIKDVNLSVGAKDVTYLDVDVGSIVGSTTSGKIEYLASLIHRTGKTASDLGDMLSETISNHDDRLRYLIYCLIKEGGEGTNDPSFLTRPSAVLRSAHEHVRTVDSWKLMMRLRQLWASLGQEKKLSLLDQSRGRAPLTSPDAAESVIAAFQRWRSWDLDDPSRSILIKSVFGRDVGGEDEPADEFPLLGACRLGELQFVLDPGPRQNKIGLLDLALRIDKRPPGQADTLSQFPNFDGSLTILNLYCGEAVIHLNWELCELAENILRLYGSARPPSTPRSISSAQDEHQKKRERDLSRPTAYHVVFEVVNGSLDAETIHLTARSTSDALKMSILICNIGTESSIANAMINCEAVNSTLKSHGQTLSNFRLTKPSVFGAHELQQSADTATHVIQASASSENMALEVRQDPIGLLEVLDLLIRDEAARLLRLKGLVPSTPDELKTREGTEPRISTTKVNVAMFLDSYVFSVPLLQSLTYKISGSVARASCSADFGKEAVFDFDIKENSHEMQINVQNEPRSISLLQIPPTNGRITTKLQPNANLIQVVASVETIRLDASAIYSILAALNRPQISGAIDEVNEQVNIIKRHIFEVFGAARASEKVAESPRSPQAAPNFAFNIHLALAGVKILAKTSLKSASEPMAQILFALDKVTLQASNQPDPAGPLLQYPDLQIDLRQISLDIRRGRPNMLRSCGNLLIGINVSASSRGGDDGQEDWSLHFRNDNFIINLFPETFSTVVDVVGYIGSKIRDLDTSRELEYLRKLRGSKPKIKINDDETNWGEETDILESMLSSVTYRFEIRNIRFCWITENESSYKDADREDLVLLIKLIEFGTRTRKSARLKIEDFLLQTVPPGHEKASRSPHSALLPEVIFNVAYVSTPESRRMAFQVVGDSLDLQLTSGFIVPAANLLRSISLSIKKAQDASQQWKIAKPTSAEGALSKTSTLPQRSIFGKKRLESLLLDADFAGAVVYVSTKTRATHIMGETRHKQTSPVGRYGQFSADDSGSGAVLRSPGLAWKAEYRDNGKEDPFLFGEVKINASNNILYPSIVPLVLDVLSSVKELVSHDADSDPLPQQPEQPKPKPAKSGDEDKFLTADPSAVLGRLRLNLGLRICRQEFSLSCQPIARVSATACFDNVYFTLNTITSQEQGNFFAISGLVANPRSSVQHVYSRDSTASIELESVTISLMNSKHFSGTSGMSAILKVSPTQVSVNAKQVQDFLLFREIWYPAEIRQSAPVQVPKMQAESSQAHLVQRYQEVAATAAFPWTATISVAALDVSVDLGQAIGKSVFQINDFWVSSKKTSNWEQNLCVGFRKVGMDCTGRLSGFFALQDFRLRSSIRWPRREEALNETPLVQASFALNALQMKAAFDYQAFLVADITSLEFLMYNVRERKDGNGDRLVAVLDGELVQVFGTTSSAAQAIALYQALQKLIQERRENFETSLKEIEKFMRRTSMGSRGTLPQPDVVTKFPADDALSKSPISLDTDVVVTLKALNLGVFPSTFSDHQVLKLEALNAYARFSGSIEQGRVHSILRMTLGQLRIGLAGVRDAEAPKAVSEMTVEDVVKRSTGSRGGTILKVPRVEAMMETWQKPTSNHIDYIFKSAFEGKVEVGWNYSRISFIRGMWANHSKSFEQAWGRRLPMSAVKITGVPEVEGEQQKITAEVNVPQSRYEYLALEPPIIETPQLRDMGEATPPLEWIGLHRERLPNLVHQIVIVSLLELAGEVEDAYSRILGSS